MHIPSLAEAGEHLRFDTGYLAQSPYGRLIGDRWRDDPQWATLITIEARELSELPWVASSVLVSFQTRPIETRDDVLVAVAPRFAIELLGWEATEYVYSVSDGPVDLTEWCERYDERDPARWADWIAGAISLKFHHETYSDDFVDSDLEPEDHIELIDTEGARIGLTVIDEIAAEAAEAGVDAGGVLNALCALLGDGIDQTTNVMELRSIAFEMLRTPTT